MDSNILSLLLLTLICKTCLISSQEIQAEIPVESVKKNVLFLMVDDMRPEIKGAAEGGIYNQNTHTPNLDELAGRSAVIKSSYIQEAFGNPSRASLLTSRRPDTLHVYSLEEHFRSFAKNVSTIPQYFKQNGYYAVGTGKVFQIFEDMDTKGQDAESWSEPFHFSERKTLQDHRFSWLGVTPENRTYNDGQTTVQLPLQDEVHAEHAMEILNNLANRTYTDGKPFFLAVGFLKPHIPFVVPEEYLQFYPPESIPPPICPHAPVNLPQVAWYPPFTEMYDFQDLTQFDLQNHLGINDTILPEEVRTNLRRAYFACVSYIDDQVGKILNHLKALELEKDTIVVFVSDHGYSLGDHGTWGKHTNFEEALLVPMMINIPGVTDNGKQISDIVELVDLFPTLADLADIPIPPTCPENSAEITSCTEGESIANLITAETPLSPSPKKQIAFSQDFRPSYQEHRVMGYSIRTKNYRYTQWVDFIDFKPVWETVFGEELYDFTSDPYSCVNQVNNTKYAQVVGELRNLLHAGWRATKPAAAPIASEASPASVVSNIQTNMIGSPELSSSNNATNLLPAGGSSYINDMFNIPSQGANVTGPSPSVNETVGQSIISVNVTNPEINVSSNVSSLASENLIPVEGASPLGSGENQLPIEGGVEGEIPGQVGVEGEAIPQVGAEGGEIQPSLGAEGENPPGDNPPPPDGTLINQPPPDDAAENQVPEDGAQVGPEGEIPSPPEFGEGNPPIPGEEGDIQPPAEEIQAPMEGETPPVDEEGGQDQPPQGVEGEVPPGGEGENPPEGEIEVPPGDEENPIEVRDYQPGAGEGEGGENQDVNPDDQAPNEDQNVEEQGPEDQGQPGEEGQTEGVEEREHSPATVLNSSWSQLSPFQHPPAAAAETQSKPFRNTPSMWLMLIPISCVLYAVCGKYCRCHEGLKERLFKPKKYSIL